MGSTKMDAQLNQCFIDILEERRKTSDILWASRRWFSKSANEQPHKYSPKQMKSIVAQSYYLKQVINQIHQSTQVPVAKLNETVNIILQEMGYDRKVPILRWLGLFVAKVLKKLCTSVYVNEAKILEIRSHMGSQPMLFVPSHRSYGDFILMSYVCFHYDIDIPRIAAGMDFQSMAIMGKVLRDACAFFMRRSFSTDKLYSAVFSEYVQTLVKDGDAPLEFFIEGTRSRTAKSLMPKYGFLSVALKPFLVGLVPDISIVPVNISYDRVLEEVLFAYELLGVPKPKESTKGFIKALSVLNENYGNIYIKFGNAFSAREYFGDKIDRSIHGVASVHMQDLTSSESKEIINLAHAIVCKQKALTVINSFNLIAAIINNSIVSGCKCLTVDDLIIEVQWLFSVLKVLTLDVSALVMDEITRDCVEDHLKLHKSLIAVTKGNIRLCRIHSRNAVLDHTNLKGHALANNTMDIAIPLLMLQYYVNPSAHFMIGLCFMDAIVQSVFEDILIRTDELFSEFKYLCSIFSYEFVFCKDFIHKDFEKALEQSINLRVLLKEDDNHVKKGDNEKLHSFCINFLKSFTPGYVVVAETLLKSAGIIHLEKEVLKTCQERIESKLNSDCMIHPANLSLDLLSNALQAFVSIGAVSKLKGNDGVRFHGHAEELKKIHSKLTSIDSRTKSKSGILQQFSVYIKSSL